MSGSYNESILLNLRTGRGEAEAAIGGGDVAQVEVGVEETVQGFGAEARGDAPVAGGEVAEVDAGVDRRDFTIRTLPARIAEVGDLWAPLRKLRPPDLGRVEKYLK